MIVINLITYIEARHIRDIWFGNIDIEQIDTWLVQVINTHPRRDELLQFAAVRRAIHAIGYAKEVMTRADYEAILMPLDYNCKKLAISLLS